VRRACLTVVLAGLIAGAAQAAEPAPAKAAEKKPAAEKDIEPIDADFLEFLGSLDTEDDDWREFLESRPINEAAGKQDPKQEKVKKP
jgi:hypothetical protein